MPAAVAIPLIVGGVTAGASITAGVMGSKAATGAAQTQSDAALKAAEIQAAASEKNALLQKQAADEALQFQKDTFAKNQENLAPWLESGKAALTQLNELTAPGSEFMKDYPAFDFKTSDFTVDPSYQFVLDEGNKALQRRAAAKGGALGGAAVKEALRYNQGAASTEYSTVYNRALEKYRTNFNVNQQNRATKFNELSGIAGTGQMTANELTAAGQSAATTSGNIVLGSAQSQAQSAAEAAAARASGYTGSANALAAGQIGGANAWTNALGQTSNSLMSTLLLQKLFASPNYNPNAAPLPPNDFEQFPISLGYPS